MSERTAPVESDTPFRYTAELADSIETAWQDRWEAEGTFNADNPVGALAGPGADKEKFFLLDMFPYPSGKGLHVGHPLGYIATDVVARFTRMTGRNVLYTMGYDAFGLPAEQYAVTTGQHPRISTEANIANMRRQLRRLGLSHDPRRSLATIDVDYVRWTQWIFLQVFNSWFDPEAPRRDGRGKGAARPVTELRDKLASGQVPVPDGRDWDALSAAEQAEVIDSFRLAYVSSAPVNWCPGLGTVLANEEVTSEGRSERGNYPVFKRNLRQWMMRITAYGDRLAEDLDTVDWPEKVKLMQRNWIGRSEGAEVTFTVPGAGQGAQQDASLSVYTTRPDTLFGATFMVVAPEHPMLGGLQASGSVRSEAQIADDAAALTVPAAWPEGTKEAWTGGYATPAEAVAERMLMLAHLTFNADVWGADRRSRYWGAFTDAAAGAVLSACLVEWWSKFVSTMGGVPLGDIALVDEKNRLLRPRLLTPPVEDSQVLRVMDTHAADLVDRTRVWVHNRRLAAQERQTRLQLGPAFDGLEEQ